MEEMKKVEELESEEEMNDVEKMENSEKTEQLDQLEFDSSSGSSSSLENSAGTTSSIPTPTDTSSSSPDHSMSYFSFCDVCHCGQFQTGNLEGYMTVSLMSGYSKDAHVERALKRFIRNYLIPLQGRAGQHPQDTGIIIWEATDIRSWAGGEMVVDIGIKITVRYDDLHEVKSSVLRFGYKIAKEADMYSKRIGRTRRNTF